VASAAKQTISWAAGLLLLAVLGIVFVRLVTRRRANEADVSVG
jgi:hypothetical protein